MNWLDYVIIVIIGLSALFAALRGFMREVVSLLGWVVAFVAASQLSGRVEPLIAPYIDSDGVVALAAFVAVFIGVLILMWLFGHLLKLVVKSIGLSWFDRLLGILFGLARGTLIVLFAFLFYLSLEVSAAAVDSSYLSPYFIDGTRQLNRLFPEDSNYLAEIKNGYGKIRLWEGLADGMPSLSGSGAPEKAPTAGDNRELQELMRKLDLERK